MINSDERLRQIFHAAMISDRNSDRTQDKKLAYADGFKQAIGWFEQRDAPFDVIEEARAMHTLMLSTLDPPKQPAPNDHWCIGCSPDPDSIVTQPCCGCERPRPADGP